ncbi:MAG: PRC-barrel domain-containing protein [Candidatus Heimdallarchaeota archaeon]|nr:PRC-barrel domain-containing protein [Candidatus Heimdallarchaeota archaeon]
MKEKEFFLVNLENVDCYSPNGVLLGKIINFSFHPEEYKLKHFIVKTAGNTELAFSIDEINEFIPGRITLKQGSDHLKYAYTLEEEEFFRKFRDFDVVDSDKELIGKITDAVFHTDNRISFIVGPIGNVFQRLGLQEKDEFILPTPLISDIEKDRIKINRTKSELQKNLTSQVMEKASPHEIPSNEIKDPRIYTRIM